MPTGDYSSYQEIEEGVRQNLDRTDLESNLSTFIRLAEKRIYRRMRLPINERVVTADITIDTPKFDIPPDYLESFQFYDSDGKPIQRMQMQQFLKLGQGSTGRGPSAVTRMAQTFVFWPASADTVTHVYYFEPAPLTTSNPTNEVSHVAGELILMAAIAEGWRYVRNQEMLSQFSQLYEGIFGELEKQWKDDETSGSSMISGNPYQGDNVARQERT